MQSILGGSSQQTTSTPIVGAGQQGQFFQGLFGSGMNNGQLSGLPSYNGPLSPDVNNTLLPTVNSQWALNNNGTNYLAGMIGANAYNPETSQIAQGVNSFNNWGGLGGPATQNMGNMATYGQVGGVPGNLMANMATQGGTGGPGSEAMGNLMQYGVGGQGSMPLNQMAQSGTAGSWGNALNNVSAGGGANGYLNQFANASGINSLQNIIQGQGNPINQLPAWQSMIGAQQRNIQEGATNLAEQFNGSDNRFSSVFGQAATDYQNQATANQNAMLGQMTNQAQQAAQNNLLSASGTLGGLGLQGAGQQSAQTYGAGNLLAQLGSGAVNQLNQNSLFGAGSVYGTQNQAATNLYNTQNSAANNMYNSQNQYNMANMGYTTNMLGLGQQGAVNYNNMLLNNLGQGSQLGQQQYNNGQSAINNQYQNYMNTLPQNNPLLPYMYGGATGYTQNTNGSSSSGLLGGLGSLLGGLGLAGGTGGISALFSDYRLKEDFSKIGEVGGLDLYTFRFKGLPKKQIGFIAQEVAQLYPEAAIPGDESTPWMIKPGVLLEALSRSAN